MLPKVIKVNSLESKKPATAIANPKSAVRIA
jgi:hypothetical protein